MAHIEEEDVMPLIATDTGGKDFAPVPQGTHLAVSNMVVSLGLQETPFGSKHQIYIRWELPNERMDYEKDGVKVNAPMTIGSFYTLSLAEKANLRHALEGWRGRAFTDEELKGFDVFTVLGHPCQITVTHNEKGKAKVTAVTGWPKGMDRPKNENPLIKYSEDDEGQFDQVPEWLQKIIKSQVTDNPPTGDGAPPIDDKDLDVPF